MTQHLTEKMVEALLPCPFCETPTPRLFNRRINDEDLDWDSYGYQCVSSECSICGPERDTEEMALQAWNSRPVLADTPMTQGLTEQMDDEDRAPMPEGLDEDTWRKADEAFHATALVADDAKCVRIIYDLIAAAPASASVAVKPMVDLLEDLRETLIQADMKIRSYPGADQSDVVFIREAIASIEAALTTRPDTREAE